MNHKKELPSIRGEDLYIPFVGAIIERTNENGKKEILIQTRYKQSDQIYSGCIEIPGGKMRAFEDIYETVRREVKEESGLEVTFIQNENNRVDLENGNDISTVVQPFCVTQMQSGPFIGLIFLCKASGTPKKITNETLDARWIDLKSLKEIIDNTPNLVYTAFLGPIKKYIDNSIDFF